MEVNIGDVAAMLDGRLEGASNVPLTGFAGIEEAGAGELTFLANPSYEGHLYTTAASPTLPLLRHCRLSATAASFITTAIASVTS